MLNSWYNMVTFLGTTLMPRLRAKELVGFRVFLIANMKRLAQPMQIKLHHVTYRIFCRTRVPTSKNDCFVELMVLRIERRA